MIKNYVLAQGAAADLKEIVRHTTAQWGEVQCLTYIDQLEKAAIAVASGEGIFKDMSALHPRLRMIKAGKHYLFCLPRPDGLPLILAILHERMDILARLEKRLT